MERLPCRLGKRPPDREHLDRQAIGDVPVVFDDDEDHAINPSRRKTSTTRGAASGPSPRISTALACSTGTRRRIFAVVAAGRVGTIRSTSFFLARNRPGTDGYRGKFRPSRTLSTAGRPTS